MHQSPHHSPLASHSTARLSLRPWDAHKMALVWVLALLPSVAITLALSGPSKGADLGLALAVVLVWQLIFARMRRLPLDWALLVPAIAFVLMLPESVPLWQQGLALSFGVVLGAQVFGGHGRGFLNPAIVALAFLHFSFAIPLNDALTPLVALAAALGGLFLLVAGLISGRVILGVGLALFVGLATFGALAQWQVLLSGPILFAVVFFICDPVAAASTNPGRFFYGLLVGALVIVFSLAGGVIGSSQAVVFAALLGSLFAPLIDWLVISANAAARRRRRDD